MTHVTVKDVLGITAQQENALKRITDALANAILEGLKLEQIDRMIQNKFPDLTLTRREVEVVVLGQQKKEGTISQSAALPGINRRASHTEKEETKRFYLEPDMLTGKTDVISVQNIGRYGDNIFVIEAETEDEAIEKLLDLLEKRVWQGQVRPATEDEAKEFEEEQDEAKKWNEWAARWAREITTPRKDEK